MTQIYRRNTDQSEETQIRGAVVRIAREGQALSPDSFRKEGETPDTPEFIAKVRNRGQAIFGVPETALTGDQDLDATNHSATDDPEAAAESANLARFKAQYEKLPKTNILAADSTWKTVQARLADPKNTEKLARVQGELDEPRLYAVLEDGSLEFVDGNPDTPPMFVKDNESGQLRIIFKRDPDQMEAARGQIEAQTHQWASIQEMLDWAKANGFEVFEADTEDKRWFGEEMKLAAAASPNGLFVGKKGGPWMATALKAARCAGFGPGDGRVGVDAPGPGRRDDHLGLLRRLRV